MFSLFAKKGPRPIPAKPRGALPEITDAEFDQEYRRVATALGVEVTQVVPSLSGALDDLGIATYSQADVEKYMDRKGYWAWFPMRAADQNFSPARATETTYPTLYGNTVFRVYRQPIPLPVLLTAEKIEQKLGRSETVFLVAAFDQHLRMDPFLGVMLRHDNSQFAIVEKWDEPGFRSR